jgi:thiol-disulfide isomerase/thioredoxin
LQIYLLFKLHLMGIKRTNFVTKISRSFILTSILLLVASNCFSQWKTSEANNIKDDIIISYEVIYEKELSLEEKKSPEYLSEIAIAFNKDHMTERRFGDKLKITNNFSLYNFNTLKAYSCSVSGTTKKALENDFKDPDVAVESAENVDSKMFFEFPCEKGLTTMNKMPKEIYYTKKIGLKYCRQFKIDGFVMQYPGYSKTLGFYTVKAKKITHNDLPDSFYSLADFTIQTMESYKKDLLESKNKMNEIRMKYIGKKADTFKEISLRNEKIDTKKMLGDVIVYNFWFTTCGPCKAEMPKLNQLKEKYKDKNVHFVAIALDEGYKIASFLKTTPLTYDIIAEGRWIAEMFGITAYPTNIIVDKKGIVQFYEIGYKSDIEERMSSTLDEYLAQ